MAPNDTQMDVLLRRYAKGATPASAGTEHLDADELNAFAEGALPAATRSRYVSHLADCDDCRTMVSQLAMSAGAGAATHVPVSEAVAPASWWQKLSGFFTPLALRYAASALVLIAVVGVAFVVWRRLPQSEQRDASLIAKNTATPPQVNAMSSPPAEAASKSAGLSASTTPERENLKETAAPGSFADRKALEPPSLDSSAAPKPAKDAAEEVPATVASERAMKAPSTESTPSYAPPPPPSAGENYRADNLQQQVATQQSVAGNARGGPRQANKATTVELAKGREYDQNKAPSNQPAENEDTRRDTGGAATSRTPAKEEPRKLRDKDKTDGADREADETTSVGGRRFRRQGNLWVDTRFKSSMSVTYVSRGSDEFAALDSGLRSIAQQLGGEVLVVWKDKAYRIR